MKRWMIVFSVVLLILNFNPSYSQACSCAEPAPVEEELERKTAVFSGKVTDISIPNNRSSTWSSADPVNVTLEVFEVWKGEVEETVTIQTVRDEASCGYHFSQDKEYIVFAYGSPDKLQTGLCERTKLLRGASEELAILGEGKAPTDPTTETKEKAQEEMKEETTEQTKENSSLEASPEVSKGNENSFIRTGQIITTVILTLFVLIIYRKTGSRL